MSTSVIRRRPVLPLNLGLKTDNVAFEQKPPAMPDRFGEQPIKLNPEKIYTGNSGKVQQAILDPSRTVAIKSNKKGTPVEEYQMLEALKKLIPPPTILPYLGTLEPKGYWLVFQWVDGGDLEQYAKKHSANIDALTSASMNVLQGLAWLHEQSIVHLDIKPANVLCTPDGQAMISDFGSARIFGDDTKKTIHSEKTNLPHTKDGSLNVTAAYASPEAVGNDMPITGSADIWSWATMMTQLYTSKISNKLDMSYDDNILASLVEPEHYTQEAKKHFTTYWPHGSPQIIELLVSCYNSTPALRPSATKILAGDAFKTAPVTSP